MCIDGSNAKSAEMVVTDASRAAIIASNGMDLFSFIEHGDEGHVLAEATPSWVLDPRVKYKHTPAVPFSRLSCHASKDLPAQKISHIFSRILEVKELFLDGIVEVGSVFSACTHDIMNTLCISKEVARSLPCAHLRL